MCNECENVDVKLNKYCRNDAKSLIETHPNLLKEWDYVENDKLGITPKNISQGSGQKVYWICLDCYESYPASICNRTKGRGCPFCDGKKVCLGNCLATLRPDLAKEWDFENNKNLTPFDITLRSGKKVYWICPICNESYDAQIYNRTGIKPTGCPYCDGKKVCLGNCLATLRPDLVEQWHPIKNEELTPFDVVPGSERKVYWLCPICNESYDAAINKRTNIKQPRGCPYCAGKKVCLENCLATLRPDLAAQWHPKLNKNLTPFDFTVRSNKKVYWLCLDCNESYDAIISNRTNKKHGSGCPHCKVYYHEQLCIEIMKEIFNKEFNKYRNNTLRNQYKRKLELDCYNEELKINIEYDGIQHYEFPNWIHKTEKQFNKGLENDYIKDQWCLENNILQIRVSYKYDTKEEIEIYIKEQLIKYNRINDAAV